MAYGQQKVVGEGISFPASPRLAVTVGLAVLVLAFASAQAQTFRVIHDFTGGVDGNEPYAGLTADAEGNLYGTTAGAATGHGTVFRLVRKNSAWLFNPLYSFAGGTDGSGPVARVVFGPDGDLYGTTQFGGGTPCYPFGCGTVFKLTPTTTPCVAVICPWTETVLYRFTNGGEPDAEVTFDAAGTIWSTTPVGGIYGICDAEGDHCGVAYKLVRSGDTWNEVALYYFGRPRDGSEPFGGVIFDASGNLYGVTIIGGYNFGTVYQLTPSEMGWSETILHQFNIDDGEYPSARLTVDNLGAIYGAAYDGGYGAGTVFRLTNANGTWTFDLLYRFAAGGAGGPARSLTVDANGNLYGTTYGDGVYNRGSVFKLTNSDGSSSYTSLHDFTGGNDGGGPLSNVLLDDHGNVYGTASQGGAYGHGVVWEITP